MDGWLMTAILDGFVDHGRVFLSPTTGGWQIQLDDDDRNSNCSEQVVVEWVTRWSRVAMADESGTSNLDTSVKLSEKETGEGKWNEVQGPQE
jgi:hypothetical protein